MKRLIIACSLVFSSALFANESIPQFTKDFNSIDVQNVEIELSDNKEVDRVYWNFGTIPVGSYSYVNFTLTAGNIPLYFRQARIAGPGFSARHNCGGILRPHGRCSFQIQFAPYFEGWSSGQFMMSFDPSYSVIVDLQGHAVRY